MKRFNIFLMLVFILQACSSKPNLPGSHIEQIQARSFSNTLFYSGTIQPLAARVISSPADGVIVDIPFQYGEPVKAEQLLFVLSSTKFLSDYKAALLQYVKTKSEFNNAEAQMKEGDFLHKNELISDDEFKTKQTNFYASQLALLQSKDSLENLLKQLDVKNVNLYQLTIADIDKITQAMHLQMNAESLRIISPSSGVILSPSKNEEETKKLCKGDAIKQGEVLALIGDMSGLSVRIKVNELTVNQLKVGQKVKITGMAFPDESLEGQIKRVDRQAEVTSNGLPTFTVEVAATQLTPKQQQDIHVGMSAKVEIHIDEAPQIMIPIVAVKEKDGASYVTLYDEKKHKVREILVKAGKTTVDSVAIISGLNAGDNLVVPDQA